jgi:Flp pilus assembly protein TadG
MRAPAFLRATGRRLRDDTSGVALLEFAFTLPILLLMSLTGAELTNYIITKMRISQIALHLADNSARIGTGSQLQAKQITEADINDLFTGAQLQSGELGLQANGRVIISSVEPHATTAGRYRIRWQRCYGNKTSWGSSYGTTAATTSVTGVGPAGRQVIAPASGVTMFVEVRYQYTPLFKTSLSPTTEIAETASMMVRDRRDTTGGTSGVYAVTGVTASPSNCA